MVFYKGKPYGDAKFLLQDALFEMSPSFDPGQNIFMDFGKPAQWNVVVVKNRTNDAKCHVFFENIEVYGQEKRKNILIGSSWDYINKKLTPVDCKIFKNERLEEVTDPQEIENLKAALHIIAKNFYIVGLDFGEGEKNSRFRDAANIPSAQGCGLSPSKRP